jgi:hypothetical protein
MAVVHLSLPGGDAPDLEPAPLAVVEMSRRAESGPGQRSG